MSNTPSPAPTYTLTLSAEERDAVLEALKQGGPLREWEIDRETAHYLDRVFDRLDAAKPKATRKPAAPKPAAPKPAAIKWQSPGLPPLRPMKVSEIDAAEDAWNREVLRARAEVAAGRESEAGIALRHLVALHSGRG